VFLEFGDREATTLPRLNLSEHEHGRLVLLEGEIRDGRSFVLPQRDLCCQA
jgi:hypothetical protein